MGPVNPGPEPSLPIHTLPSTAGFISLTENCPSLVSTNPFDRKRVSGLQELSAVSFSH